MTSRTRWAPGACLAWAVLGGSIGAAGFGAVNPDSRLLVLTAIVTGVTSAVGAAGLMARHRPRLAGLCLIVSAIMPTWAAVWLNLLPLTAGVLLLAWPSRRSASRT